MTPQRLMRLRIEAKQCLQTGAGVNAHRVLELLDAYDLVREREEPMWDLSIKQLQKMHEALCLLAAEGHGGNGDLSALKLADQVDIEIAARKAEAHRLVAPQGTMHVELKGR